MNDLISKLKECTTLGQADPILSQLGAGAAVKKLVETSIILSNSSDRQQRSHAFSFMEAAIHELRTSGSHQATYRNSPYPNPGHYSNNGENSMMHMQGAMNQWSLSRMIELIQQYSNDVINHYHKNHINPKQKGLVNQIKKTGEQIRKNQVRINNDKQRIKELRGEMKEVKTDFRKDVMGYTMIQETTPNSVWNKPSKKSDLQTTRNAINLMDRMTGNGNPEFMYQPV